MRSIVLAGLFCALATAASASAQRIALTFDDLPSHSPLPLGTTRVKIASEIIAALKAAHTPPVYGFVNGLRLKNDPLSAPVLEMWRDAGYLLGNHTYSHYSLSHRTLDAWTADTVKNEAVIAPLMAGQDWHWLRFPHSDEGDTLQKHVEARAWLARHGYKVASVTMSFDDYLWNDAYPRCVARHDAKAIKRLETAFLSAAELSLAFYHNLSMQLYGRDIPYVLVMHLGAFDARMLPRLLAMYQAKGVTFVSLQDAERDPFYAGDVDPSLPAGPVDLEQAMVAKGVSYVERNENVLPFETMCR
jgi:peptidoglycan/xylan/chitin deacetylase (PgdA/CDA1 family)